MLLERQPGIGLVVFRSDRQQDAFPFQSEDKRLEIRIGFARRSAAEADAVEAVLADHASPQRAVEVEHQAFATETGRRRQQRGRVAGKVGQGLGGDRLLRQVPVAIVEPPRRSETGGQAVAVQDRHIGRRLAQEPKVEQARHQMARRNATRQVAERVVRVERKAVLDGARAGPADRGPQLLPAFELALDVSLGLLTECGKLERALVDGQDHDGGFKRIKLAGGVEQVLRVLAEAALIEFEVDALTKCRHPKQRRKLRRGVAACDGGPDPARHVGLARPP